MDGWCVTVGRRGSQVKGERPSQGLASGSPSCPRGHPLLTAFVEPLSFSNEMGGGEQHATVSDGERWTTVDPNGCHKTGIVSRLCRFLIGDAGFPPGFSRRAE